MESQERLEVNHLFQDSRLIKLNPSIVAIGSLTALFLTLIAGIITSSGKEINPDSPLGQGIAPLATQFDKTCKSSTADDLQSGPSDPKTLTDIKNQRTKKIEAQPGCEDKSSWYCRAVSGTDDMQATISNRVNFGCEQ